MCLRPRASFHASLVGSLSETLRFGLVLQGVNA